MKPPIEPRKEDCCNSGCNPCIFDVFQRQLEKYIDSKDAEDQINEQNGISEMDYTVFIVIDANNLCNFLKIIKFKRLNNSHNFRVWWKPGDHFLIKYTSESDITCTKAYTPIKLKSQTREGFDFLLIVKKYEGGQVSNYLFDLKIGQETLWRGPYGHYNVEVNKFKRIIMIAQGTGIAPFISIIDNILNNEDNMTTIVLCFCCRSFNEILFRNELYEFNTYWNFSYKVFLSNQTSDVRHNFMYKEPIVSQKFCSKELNNLKPHCDTQFLLSGSIQFMKEYKDSIEKDDNTNVILF